MLQYARVTADEPPEEHWASGQGLGRHAADARLRLSTVSLIAATGVLIVAAAYTAGRAGYASSAWADRAYWLGQALVVVPAAAWLLSRRVLTAGLTMGLVTVFTVAEYLVTICYSPLQFEYADELSHWRTTVNILHTGQLFTRNYVLPISPHYPGLEELTSALVSVTRLPVFTCGLIVAGVAHLLFVYLLYLLYLRIRRLIPDRGHRRPVLREQFALLLVRFDVHLPDARPALLRPHLAGRLAAGLAPGRREPRRLGDGGAAGHRGHGGNPPRHQLHAGGRLAAAQPGRPGHGQLPHRGLGRWPGPAVGRGGSWAGWSWPPPAR